MDRKDRFYGAIAALTPGNRDANLVRVATYGVGAGLSPQEVFDAIMQNAPGNTRPDANAVCRAIGNCYAATKPRTACEPVSRIVRWTRKSEAEKLEDFRRSLPDEVRASVSKLVTASPAATLDDLILNSPTPIPLDPREQAAAHIRALGTDWRWKCWCGTISGNGKRGLVVEPSTIAAAVETRLSKVPTHISLNPLTGGEGRTKEGKPSYDCAETVAALRFMLVEFDEMPLSAQLSLWTSVVRTLRSEVPVVSIVYSGSKSLHAVVLCPPADIYRDEIADADRAAYSAAWDRLARRFASSRNSAERMDLAPMKNPAIHTRVAGAVRAETGKHQTLLYLDAALAKSQLEIF